MIVKEGKISVSIVNPGRACVLVTLAFAIPVFYSFGQPLALGVSTVPKVEKEQQEDASVTHDDVQENWVLVLAVLHEEDLAYVDSDKNKLDKLQRCQMFFPPKILLVGWSHRTQSIVGIHNHMHSSV